MRGAREEIGRVLVESPYSVTTQFVLERLRERLSGYEPSPRAIAMVIRDYGWEGRRERLKGGGTATVYRPGRQAAIGAGTQAKTPVNAAGPSLLDAAEDVLNSSFARNYRLISPFKELAAAVDATRRAAK